MFSSTTFSSSSRRLQRANPSGAGEQAKAINLASAAPSKIRDGRNSDCICASASPRALPRPIVACVATVLMLVSNAAAISLSLHPSPASDVYALNRILALVIICAEFLPERTIASSRSRSSPPNFTTYFFAPVLVPATNYPHPRPVGAGTEIFIDRGRDAHYRAPPAQIRAGPINALGSYLGCLTAKRAFGPRVEDARRGEPRSMTRRIRSHGIVLLAATPERLQPEPVHMMPEAPRLRRLVGTAW